jgi:Zn-dependent protease
MWCLAVFAFFPLLGLPLALALGTCSLLLLGRRDPLRWDRRLGATGLVLALAALAAAVLWVVMWLLRGTFPFTFPDDYRVEENRSWLVNALQFAVLVVSIMLHECAHAVAAYWSGDGTAARQGRITLNPLAHVDVFGSILLPVILSMVPGGVAFGWAKPVPVDRRQLRHPRRGLLAVTLAGVSVNLLLSLACATGLLVVGTILRLAFPDGTSQGFSMILAETQFQGVPASPALLLLISGLKTGVLINLVLFTFNLLPIPPLDGFGVLESAVPRSLNPLVHSLRAFGWLGLLILIGTGIVTYLLIPGVFAAAALNMMAGVVTGWG